jgi:hypothetical protein
MKDEWNTSPSEERFDNVFEEGINLLKSQDKLIYADDLHPLIDYVYVRWNRSNIVRSCFRRLTKLALIDDTIEYDATCNVEIDVNSATHLRIYDHKKGLPLTDINSWEIEGKRNG